MKNTDEMKALIAQEPQDLMVSINRAAISAMTNQMELLKEFVKGQLKEGNDYGSFGGAKKDSLLKPGAEKLKRLFNLGDRIIDAKESHEDGQVKYRYTIEVYSLKTGIGIAQCVGIASSHEKSQWAKDPLKFENSISKIAQKRALVGAVIVATNASDFFTQDLEDGVIDVERPAQPIAPPMPEGEYRIPFGKHKGKKLDEVSPDDLFGYCDWLQQNAREENKPLSARAVDFIKRVSEFLKSEGT